MPAERAFSEKVKSDVIGLQIFVLLQLLYGLQKVREGSKKKTANYPHFVDKGGGSPNVDKRGGGAVAALIDAFLDILLHI